MDAPRAIWMQIAARISLASPYWTSMEWLSSKGCDTSAYDTEADSESAGPSPDP